ncbi:MAG UNVERIFIED_CONTAM: hypothetical protein LVR29_06315 [Microcystis novacekii LVE1205-3]|jgi:hypothetical protein
MGFLVIVNGREQLGSIPFGDWGLGIGDWGMVYLSQFQEKLSHLSKTIGEVGCYRNFCIRFS